MKRFRDVFASIFRRRPATVGRERVETPGERIAQLEARVARLEEAVCCEGEREALLSSVIAQAAEAASRANGKARGACQRAETAVEEARQLRHMLADEVRGINNRIDAVKRGVPSA